MLSWLKTTLAGVLLCHLALAHALVAVPAAGARVTDLTQTMSVGETETLAQELERIDEQTGARLLVLMVPTLDGEPVEDFAQRVFDAWKPGRKGVDDGVLLVLAKHERKIRIAVGRGLEGALPDLLAKRISQSSMVPAFKQDRFADGFTAAARDIEKLVRAEKLQPVQQASSGEAPSSSTVSVAVVCGLLVLLGGGWFYSSWRAGREEQRRAREREAAMAAMAAEREREQGRRRTWAEPYVAAQRSATPAAPRVTPSNTRRVSAAAPPPAAATARRDDDTASVVTGYGGFGGGFGGGSDNESKTSSNDYSVSSSDGTSAGGGATDSY